MDTDQRSLAIDHHLRVTLDEGAHEHGYRIDKGEAAGWRFYQSATAPGEIALGGSGVAGPFFLSVKHHGVAKDVQFQDAGRPAYGFQMAFAFETRDTLFDAISEVYRKSRTLPNEPLEQFHIQTKGLGDTELERKEKVRIGQDIFRNSLLEYWDKVCPLTGISNSELLRASHIIPWAECQSDDERLNVYNGLILSSLWDAAFDAGLVSFSDDGRVLLASELSKEATELLDPKSVPVLKLTEQHAFRLQWHRSNVFRG